MHKQELLPALLWGVLATVCGLSVAAGSARADFVVNDRLVSDGVTNIGNPTYDPFDNLLVWQDTLNNVWLGTFNPIAGTISPTNGMGKLLDTQAAPSSVTTQSVLFAKGNGVASAAYTRYVNGNVALGQADQDANGVWSLTSVASGTNRWKPEGSYSYQVGPAKEAYNYSPNGINSTPNYVAARQLDNPASEVLVSGPTIGGARFLANENKIVGVITVKGVQQLSVTDLDAPNPSPVQITFESQPVFTAYAWPAPEFGGSPAIVATVGGTQLAVFRRNPDNTWTKYYSFASPDPNYPYFSNPKGWVANGKSYVDFVAMQSLGTSLYPYQPTKPSEVWIGGIDSTQPFFRRIDDPTRNTLKAEPEVFMLASGPAAFYNEKSKNSSSLPWVLRVADTGLGTHWGYDSQAYFGPWAAPYRDNKNCSCTPFAVGDGYQESTTLPTTLTNQQYNRQIMGPEGHVYATATTTSNTVATGYNTPTNGSRVFGVKDSDLGGNLIANGLAASNGDVFLAGNTTIARYTNTGTRVWSSAIRGSPKVLQYGPDGNIIAFTFNGWFQVFSPSTGALLGEKYLTIYTPSFPPTSDCMTTGGCAFPGSPAVDVSRSVIYVTYMPNNTSSLVQAYNYDPQSHIVTFSWETPVYSGTISSPVLSADYSRIYFQSMDGNLRAFDVNTQKQVWSLNLSTSIAGTPVVNEFGYIMPTIRQSGSAAVNYVGIVQDNGTSASWAFKSTDYAAASPAAVGRGNRFVVAATRNSDAATMLLVVNPNFGITSKTQITINPVPTSLSSTLLDQNGNVYVGTWGSTVYRAFTPTYATAVK